MENLIHRFVVEFEKSIPALVIASCATLFLIIARIIMYRTRKDPGDDIMIISIRNGKDKYEIRTTRRELHSEATLQKIEYLNNAPS